VRLDAELVRRSLARSRAQASEFIALGLVHVDGLKATKPSTQVDKAQAITVATPQESYVSRGAHKLEGALRALESYKLLENIYDGNNPEKSDESITATPDITEESAWRACLVAPTMSVAPDITGESEKYSESTASSPLIAGKIALDAGASTGGFTEVLLRRGAARVYAVDVGYGQLAWQLRTDSRVDVRDRTNIRYVQPADFDPRPNLIVADLSFISLTLVLEPLKSVATEDADYLLMVKPQFEVGKGKTDHGVVTSPQLRADAVAVVVEAAERIELGTHSIVKSPLPGPKGNIEYFIHLRRGEGPFTGDSALQLVHNIVFDNDTLAKDNVG
jgi:23S rRNA (cytidine1920-2'-O)/16S rRNA (cytidine1409-2'-O)-methyltransferase